MKKKLVLVAVLVVVLLAVASIVLAAVFNDDGQTEGNGGSGTGTTESTELDFNFEDIFGSGEIVLPDDEVDDDTTVPSTGGTTASTQNKNENSGDKMPTADTFKIFYASGCLETLDDGVINQEKKTMLQTAIEGNGYHIFPEDMRTDLNGVTTLSGYDLYIFEDLGLVDVTLDGGAVWYINSWAQGTMLGENVGQGSYSFEVSDPNAKDIASITIKQGVLFNELTTSDGKVKATVENYRAVSQDLQKYTAVYSFGEAPLILAAEDGGRAVIVVTLAFENSNLNMYRANFKKLVANFIDFSG